MTSNRCLTLGLVSSLALFGSGCDAIQSLTDAGTSDAGSTNLGPACGDDAGTPCVITIKDFKYEPEALNVAPGTVVTVKNMDVMVHTATSEVAQGRFVAGPSSGISFDTGNIQGGQTGSFTVPSDARIGATVYYICTVHLQAMANEPHITVVH